MSVDTHPATPLEALQRAVPDQRQFTFPNAGARIELLISRGGDVGRYVNSVVQSLVEHNKPGLALSVFNDGRLNSASSTDIALIGQITRNLITAKVPQVALACAASAGRFGRDVEQTVRLNAPAYVQKLEAAAAQARQQAASQQRVGMHPTIPPGAKP